MSPEAEKILEDFKKNWVGKTVKIISINHPHYGESGEVISVDYTNAGWGVRIKLENYEECYVFNGHDIKELKP